jgi:hypothetical protein
MRVGDFFFDLFLAISKELTIFVETFKNKNRHGKQTKIKRSTSN